MEKKFQFFRKLLLLTLLMLGVGSAFGDDEKCPANTQWGEFKTVVATKGSDNYYEIDTPEKLAWFACEVTMGSYTINAKLTQSIDLQKKIFIPIAAGKGNNGAEAYKGIFNGQNYSISNMYINTSEITKEEYGGIVDYAQNVAFVAVLNKNGKIMNLTLDNVEIIASSSAGAAGLAGSDKPISVGSFVGWQVDGTIENCVATGQIKTNGSQNRVGGISGNVKNATITRCVCEVTIVATGANTHVGGIVGAIRNNGTVNLSSCAFAGETPVSLGGGSVGGIVGSYEKANSVESTDMYYDTEVGSGVGYGDENAVHTDGVESVNEEEIICKLNKGTLNDDGVCSSQAPWSVGENGLSLQGSDGYKIVFDANQGIFVNETTRYKFLPKDASITSDGISQPSREGYVFVGWSLLSGENNEVGDLGTVSGVTTVYAVWNPVYNIKFNVSPGTFPSENPSEIVSEKTKTVPKGSVITVENLGILPTFYCSDSNLPEDECENGNYFTGWSLQPSNISNRTRIELEDVAPSEGLTFYAYWENVKTYTVTYNANQHGKTTVDFVRIGEGETLSQPTDPVADEGYKFGGWYTEADCENKYIFNNQINHSFVLYADWTPLSYEIDYVMNEGSDKGENPESYTIEDEVILNDPVEVDGYDFKGWFYDAAFTDKATKIEQNTTGKKIFYAKWSKKSYKITYLNDQNSKGAAPDQNKEYGSAITLLSSGHYIRNDYVQDGWTTTEDGAKSYELGGIYSANADVTLYPHWANNLTVTQYGAVTINDYGDHKEAVINGNYGAKTKTNERDAVAILNDIEVSSVVMTRIFPVNSYTTIVLPFRVNTANVGGLKAVLYYNGIKTVNKKSTIRMKVLWAEDNYIKDENNEYVHYEHTDMEANTPYMLIMNDPTFAVTGVNSITLVETQPAETPLDGWTFRGVWKYKEWGPKQEDSPNNYDPETGYAYGFSAATATGISVGDFVRAGEGAWIRPMRAYLVKTSEMAQLARANGAYVKRPSVVQEELPEIMSIVIDNGRDDEQTTVIGHFNTRTGEIKMIPQNRTFDVKGRNVGNKANKARGAYYGKKVKK